MNWLQLERELKITDDSRVRAMQLFRLSVAPVFFFLAFINVGFQDHTVHMMSGASVTILGFIVSPGLVQIFTSMWLMYALMGVAHLTPWVSLCRSSVTSDSEF